MPKTYKTKKDLDKDSVADKKKPAKQTKSKKESKLKKKEDVVVSEETTNDAIEQEEIKLSEKKQEIADYLKTVMATARNVFDVEEGMKEKEKISCQMCKQDKYASEFFKSYSIKDIGNIQQNGERHSSICKKCCKKMFNHFLDKSNNLFESLNHFCQIMDLYFSGEIVDAMIRLHESRKGTQMEWKFDYVTDYITALGRARMLGMTYWDSPYLQNNVCQINADEISDEFLKYEDKVDQHKKEYPADMQGWDQEDLENYDNVVEMYRYDPFKDECQEDRKKLYHLLNGFSTEDILEDTGKADACVDMCRCMQRLEKLNKRRIQMERMDDYDINDLKKITEIQQKERDSIHKYQKEWGFNSRYSLNKTKGAGTFTGIIKQMDDSMFEDELVNAYDIKTSNSIKMAAEASWKAIFGQLNLSESEFSKVVSDQRETIMKLRKELDDVREKLRQTNIKIKRQMLQDQLDKER